MIDNKVIGNKSGDNKDPQNRQKAASATSEGKFHTLGNVKLRPQNDPVRTNQQASETGGTNQQVKSIGKRAKNIIRRPGTYSDGAIDVALRMRGK